MDIIYSLYEQRTVLGLLPLLMSSRNHEQGLGRELGAARAGLVAPVAAGHVVVSVSDAFFEERT